MEEEFDPNAIEAALADIVVNKIRRKHNQTTFLKQNYKQI